MFGSKLLHTAARFLKNRDKVLYKSSGEALRDFSKVSGANVLIHVGLAVLIAEFGFPTPDIVYDIKMTISPDFALFAKYGELAEHNLGFENKLRSIRREEEKTDEKRLFGKSPEAKFGGII